MQNSVTKRDKIKSVADEAPSKSKTLTDDDAKTPNQQMRETSWSTMETSTGFPYLPSLQENIILENSMKKLTISDETIDDISEPSMTYFCLIESDSNGNNKKELLL